MQTTENLNVLRKQIDECDEELIRILSKRMKICREVGTYKKEHNMSVLQSERYKEILEKRACQGSLSGIDTKCIKIIFEAIHEESVNQQLKILNK